MYDLFHVGDINVMVTIGMGCLFTNLGNTINIPYTLRSLPDGTKDYIEVDDIAKTAKLATNIGELILNGSEDWRLQAQYNRITGLYCYSMAISDKLNGLVICSHFS